MAEKLYTVEEAADYLNVPVGTLRFLRHTNQGPQALKVGRLLRYRESALDAYVLEQERAETVKSN